MLKQLLIYSYLLDGLEMYEFSSFTFITAEYNDSAIVTAYAKFEGSVTGLLYGECVSSSNISLSCVMPQGFNVSQNLSISLKVGEFTEEGNWSAPVTAHIFSMFMILFYIIEVSYIHISDRPRIVDVQVINKDSTILITGN